MGILLTKDYNFHFTFQEPQDLDIQTSKTFYVYQKQH